MNVSADAHQLWIAGMACGKTAFKTRVLILCLNSVGRQFLHGHSQLMVTNEGIQTTSVKPCYIMLHFNFLFNRLNFKPDYFSALKKAENCSN